MTILDIGNGVPGSLLYFDLTAARPKVVLQKDLGGVVGQKKGSKCRFLTTCHGKLYVADLGLDMVYVLDKHANLLMMFGRTGSDRGCFSDPAGLGVDHVGNMVVADSRNHRISVWSKDGRFISNLHLKPSVRRPSGIYLDRYRRHLYVLNLGGSLACVKYDLS